MPERIGHYELLERLGKGAMGIAWRARDTRTGQTVALKILHPHLTEDLDAIARLGREGRIGGAMVHQNIVRAIDQGRDGDNFYIVMELVDGESVADRLHREGRLSEAETIRIAVAAANALEAAWAHNVVHRDIKPANVLLGRDGSVKVSDFGVARAIGSTTLTFSGAFVGTPAYAAPEVWDTANPDVRCDLYSLGAMMFEMLTGQLPFNADSPGQMMRKHQTEAPDLGPVRQASRPLAPIIARLLEKNPANRYQTPAKLRAALLEIKDAATEMVPDLTTIPERGTRRLRSMATQRLSTVWRMPKRYKLAVAVIALFLTAGAIAIAVFSGGQQATAAVPFSSGPSWEAWSGDPNPETGPPGVNLGQAKPVCLRETYPPDCSSDAYRYGYQLPGWDLPYQDLGDAQWIWAPVDFHAEKADGAEYFFRTTFDLERQPGDLFIAFAADREADLIVNQILVFDSTRVDGPNSLTYWNIGPMLKAGSNELIVQVKNDDRSNTGDCDPVGDADVACAYDQNPAGFILAAPVDIPLSR